MRGACDARRRRSTARALPRGASSERFTRRAHGRSDYLRRLPPAAAPATATASDATRSALDGARRLDDRRARAAWTTTSSRDPATTLLHPAPRRRAPTSARRVLKHGDTFAVFDRYGDIQPVGLGEQGAVPRGHALPLAAASCASAASGRCSSARPSARTTTLLAVDLTNPDLATATARHLPRGTLHIFRTKFLWQGVCYERLRVAQLRPGAGRRRAARCTSTPTSPTSSRCAARGAQRRGDAARRPSTTARVVLGLRGPRRRRAAHAPEVLAAARASSTASEARFDVAAAAAGRGDALPDRRLRDRASRRRRVPPPTTTPHAALAAASARRARPRCAIDTSNEQFNDWLQPLAAPTCT